MPKRTFLKSISISSLSKKRETQEVDGMPGQVDYGFIFENRTGVVEFYCEAYDAIDFKLLRNEIYDLLGSYNHLYVAEKELPSRFLRVHIDDSIDIEQFGVRWGLFSINLTTTELPFWQSIYTTKELNDTGYSTEAMLPLTDKERENFNPGSLNLIKNSAYGSNVVFSRNNSAIDNARITVEDGYNKIVPIEPVTRISLYSDLIFTDLKAGVEYIDTIEVYSPIEIEIGMDSSMRSGKVVKPYTWTRLERREVHNGGNYRFSGFYTRSGDKIPNEILYRNLSLREYEKGMDMTWRPSPDDFDNYDDFIRYFVGKGKYGLVDGIHDELQKYRFTERNFTVWNAGNVKVQPEFMYLKITVTGTNGELEIRNKATGQVFTVETDFGGDLILDGMNYELNGVNVFRDTNKKRISIVPRENKFEIVGEFTDITIDFKFYYK